MSLEFGVPGADASGTPFSYAAPYSRFLIRVAQRHPGQWVVMERQRVAASGSARVVALRRMSGRAKNVRTCALTRGACVDVTTRVVGTTATTYVRSDDEG